MGDLVFFNTSGKGVSHAGMYIGSGKFIHASTSKGVRVDKLNDPYYWGNKYVGAKKVASVYVAKNNDPYNRFSGKAETVFLLFSTRVD